MNYLVDVNVWVALALAGHVHHAEAQGWFDELSIDARLFFCRVTQMGLLRLLTNGRVMGANVLSTAGAWRYYDSFLDGDRIRFAAEPPGLEKLWREVTERTRVGSNLWTDAYLSAFAGAAKFTVVTFDRAFHHHAGVKVRILSPAH